MTYMEISNRRKEYNISQTKLAVYSGFSKSLISSWERKIQQPNEEQLNLLKDVIEDLSQKVINGDPNIVKKKVRHSGERKGKLPSTIKDKKEYDSDISNMKYTSEYALELSDLYTKAEKSKKNNSLKGIALFSGCGGMTLGFEAAGVDVVGHVEISDAANRIYSENFQKSKLLGKDICEVSDDNIAEWKKEFGTIDFIIGGPPCQGFSLAGKRNPEDERNKLYQQYVRIVSQINPKVFVFENVALMTSMKDLDGNLFIDRIEKEFRKVGYRIYRKVLNAQNFGVPQSRERVILVGVSEILKGEYVFPQGDYCDISNDNQMVLPEIQKKPYRSFRDATSDLESVENGEKSTNDPLHWAISHPQHVIEWLKDVPEGHSAHENENPEMRPPSGFNTTYKRITWDDPCSTISTNFSMISGCRNVHPYNTRSLTIREATRAQSFPDEFVFAGNWGEVRKAIGNAVPPILAKEVANSILEQYFKEEMNHGINTK